MIRPMEIRLYLYKDFVQLLTKERNSKKYAIFEKKFAWVKKDPWKENEAPFVKVYIKKKIEWGLKMGKT